MRETFFLLDWHLWRSCDVILWHFFWHHFFLWFLFSFFKFASKFFFFWVIYYPLKISLRIGGTWRIGRTWSYPFSLKFAFKVLQVLYVIRNIFVLPKIKKKMEKVLVCYEWSFDCLNECLKNVDGYFKGVKKRADTSVHPLEYSKSKSHIITVIYFMKRRINEKTIFWDFTLPLTILLLLISVIKWFGQMNIFENNNIIFHLIFPQSIPHFWLKLFF